MLSLILFVTILTLIGLVVFFEIVNRMNDRRREQLNQLIGNVDSLTRIVTNMQTGNTIHLGLKDERVSIGIASVSLTIQPEDFKLRADRLYTLLLEGLQVKEQSDVSTRVYCIFERAGLNDIMELHSKIAAKKALMRLLVNNNTAATKRFLKTLAESIAKASAATK